MTDEVALGSQIAVVNGQLVARGETPAEVKIAIKELRLLKKEETAKRREASARLKEIRAERRAVVAKRLPMIRGGGMLGSLVRGGVQAKRAADRGAHDDRIVEVERVVMAIDRNILNIDKVIAQCEAALLRMQA